VPVVAAVRAPPRHRRAAPASRRQLGLARAPRSAAARVGRGVVVVAVTGGDGGGAGGGEEAVCGEEARGKGGGIN
jgi:hypothetical protein